MQKSNPSNKTTVPTASHTQTHIHNERDSQSQRDWKSLVFIRVCFHVSLRSTSVSPSDSERLLHVKSQTLSSKSQLYAFIWGMTWGQICSIEGKLFRGVWNRSDPNELSATKQQNKTASDFKSSPTLNAAQWADTRCFLQLYILAEELLFNKAECLSVLQMEVPSVHVLNYDVWPDRNFKTQSSDASAQGALFEIQRCTAWANLSPLLLTRQIHLMCTFACLPNAQFS